MERGAKFHGQPCAKCGNTWRYVDRKRCVHCRRLTNDKRYATEMGKTISLLRKENEELRACGDCLKHIAAKIGYDVDTIKRGIIVAQEFGMDACRE